MNVESVETDIVETETFQPVRVTVVYEFKNHRNVWRTTSFATARSEDEQTMIAKALYAENLDLRALEKYKGASLNLAVQMPKPTARQHWRDAVGWLERESDRVEVFEDTNSLEQKIPSLVA